MSLEFNANRKYKMYLAGAADKSDVVLVILYVRDFLFHFGPEI